MLQSKRSLFYNVKNLFLSYEYSLSGSILCEIVFYKLYVSKTEITQASYKIICLKLIIIFGSGSPFIAHVEGDLPLVSGTSLTSAPVSTTSYFTMSNVSGSLDDIEVNVEGKF